VSKDYRKIWKNLSKGLVWTFLTVLFGLLQLWLILWYDFMVVDNIISYKDIFKEGFILFFISAVVSTISIDFFLSDLKFSRRTVGFFFVLFPLVILILSVTTFLICMIGNKEIKPNINIGLQASLMAMTCIYAIGIKALKFYYT